MGILLKNRWFRLVVVVFGVSVASAAFSPPASYVEVVPQRALYKGAKSNVPPSWPVFPTATPGKDVVAVKEGFVVLAEGKMFFGPAFAAVAFDQADLPGGSRLVAFNGALVGFASPDQFCSLSCSFSASQSSCKAIDCKAFGSRGDINDVAASLDQTKAGEVTRVWCVGTAGLLTVAIDAAGKIGQVQEVQGMSTLPLLSVAVSGNAASGSASPPTVVVGSSEKLWHIDYFNAERIMRFEWVTDIESGAGGVLSSTVTSLAFSNDFNGGADLFIGTQNNLNVRFGDNGTYTTVNGDKGLPTSNITCIAFATAVRNVQGENVAQLWIGTTSGLSVWEKGSDPEFRYLHKERWLAGSTIKRLAVVPRKVDAKLMGDTIVAVAEEGITVLEQQEWTLEGKAEVFQTIQLERHNRNGLTAQCQLPSFGDNSKTVCSDNDNNGLWTSLVVAAGYFKYSITKAPEDLKFASTFFGGMVRLNEVTGIRGLMARSLCAPSEEPFVKCGTGGKPGQWRNSTNPNYEGWSWKSDTSSDETTGHVFALSLVAKLSPVPSERELAGTLLSNFVLGLVRNGYKLIDWTGKPTSWGQWDPAQLNDFRPWSDGRGVNSMQMLAYLSAAYHFANDTCREELLGHYRELTNETNQYNENVMNLKITAPSDDNYSDDELTFLPYFTFLFFCQNSSTCPFDRAPVLTSMERTFQIVRPERPDLWDAIYLATSGNQDDSIVRDIVWNLRTWPLELIRWPVSNAERQDILYDLAVTRFGFKDVQSLHTRPPLPSNERMQGLWNGNPWIVTASGSGMSEDDAGAWLLPYWMARFFGVLNHS